MYDAADPSFDHEVHQDHGVPEAASGSDPRADPRAGSRVDRREEQGGSPSQAEEFSLELDEERGVPVLVAAGELDLYAMPRMRALMVEAMARVGGPRSGPRRFAGPVYLLRSIDFRVLRQFK